MVMNENQAISVVSTLEATSLLILANSDPVIRKTGLDIINNLHYISQQYSTQKTLASTIHENRYYIMQKARYHLLVRACGGADLSLDLVQM